MDDEEGKSDDVCLSCDNFMYNKLGIVVSLQKLKKNKNKVLTFKLKYF